VCPYHAPVGTDRRAVRFVGLRANRVRKKQVGHPGGAPLPCTGRDGSPSRPICRIAHERGPEEQVGHPGGAPLPMKTVSRCPPGRDGCSAALRDLLTRSLPRISPSGHPSDVSRAASHAAWVCSLHQTLDFPHPQSAIARVLPSRPICRIARETRPGRTSRAPRRCAPTDEDGVAPVEERHPRHRPKSPTKIKKFVDGFRGAWYRFHSHMTI